MSPRVSLPTGLTRGRYRAEIISAFLADAEGF